MVKHLHLTTNQTNNHNNSHKNLEIQPDILKEKVSSNFSRIQFLLEYKDFFLGGGG
jgi:hypothetical protein